MRNLGAAACILLADAEKSGDGNTETKTREGRE